MSTKKLVLPDGKPTTEAKQYLASLKPGVRTLVRDRAREMAAEQNRAYITVAMCGRAYDEVFAEPTQEGTN